MKLEQESDESLIEQYAKGNYEAFATLYKRHKGGLFRYISRQTEKQSVVDDLFQDVWGKVIENAESFNANAKFSTWLYTIARHKLIDHIRHIKVVSNVIDDKYEDSEQQPCEKNSPDLIDQRKRQMQAIDRCLEKLPTHQLDCFLLREETGLAIADIAYIVNSGLEATKSRLRSAYKSLRRCLKNQNGEQYNAEDTRGGKSK